MIEEFMTEMPKERTQYIIKTYEGEVNICEWQPAKFFSSIINCQVYKLNVIEDYQETPKAWGNVYGLYKLEEMEGDRDEH